MRNTTRSTLCAMLAMVSLVFANVAIDDANAQSGPVYHVSGDGSDGHPGTSNRPFATLARARDAVREQIANGLTGPVMVLIHGGRYRLSDTIVFGPADSPGGDFHVTYAAAPGETPVFDSGVPIRNWQRFTGKLAGLPQAAEGKLWVAEVPEGLDRFFTLYDGDRLLPRARTEGFSPTKTSGNWHGDRPDDRTTIHLPPGTIHNWSNFTSAELLIIPTADWTMNILPIVSVDEGRSIARTSVPGTYALGAQKKAGHWPKTAWIENVPAALDQPGEWFLDWNDGKVYLWPEDQRPSDEIVAPALAEYIRVEGLIDHDGPEDEPVRGLTFRGLTFTHGRRDLWDADHAGLGLQHDWDMYDRGNALVRFRGAEHCAVEDCSFVSTSGSALRLDWHCQHVSVQGNTIAYVGGTGILLSGYGPGTKDVNHHNEVVNNHIHHTGRLYWHGLGIFVTQSGYNRIAHNLIHHTPYTALVVSGVRNITKDTRSDSARTIRWHEVDRERPFPETIPYLHAKDNLIEYNEIHHAMERLGDGNGIYISGAGEGNVIRRNYVHHILGPFAASAIRTDGCQLGTVMTENIVYRSTYRGFVVKYNNDCTNNIIVDVRGATTDFGTHRDVTGYLGISPKPSMIPRGAKLQNNVFYQTQGAAPFYQALGRRTFEWLKDNDVDGNVYYNAADPQHAAESLKTYQALGVDVSSVAADPLFVDVAAGDFRLRPDSPALKLGFNEIDVSRIGPTGKYAAGFRRDKSK